MARKKSSRNWMQRHVKDHFVQKAQQAGYRSRAAFKLLEIQQKDKILRPGINVVDLGAAPGGWSQIAADIVGEHGRVIALDILRMDALDGVQFIEGDFREPAVLQALENTVNQEPIDLVICDMAPNISGVKAVDQPRSMYLAELALDFAISVLKPGGVFLVKLFAGEGNDEYRQLAKQHFRSVMTRKPKSSRSESTEFYLLCRDRIVTEQ